MAGWRRGGPGLVACVATVVAVLVAGSTGALPAPAAALPPFRATVVPLTVAERSAMTPSAWRPGCPVPLADLRAVRATHLGFDGRARTGVLVVHRDVAPRVVAVLRRLYALRFPIRRMEPIERYGGSDSRSIEADNTSAFNCRRVEGTSRWSEHAYGRAIDVNPIENPYISRAGTTEHPTSRPYLDRTRRRPGVILPGDAVVHAFAAEGFGWGGLWSSARDTQHFSSTGR